MPPSGSRPKPAGQAVTRHQKTQDWVDVPDKPNRARPLPARRRERKAWPKGIEERWRSWSQMPHTRLWKDSDWQFAADTLEVAALALERGSAILLAELRNREKTMGTTWDARRALRLNYVEPGKTAPAVVTSLDDYRAL